MRSTLILRQYIRELLTETADKKFLAEFMPLHDEWLELQAQYGPVHSGPWQNPETGEMHYPEEVQSVPAEEQPRWVRDDPKFYAAHEDHPNTRRASFSQTQAEENIEKALLRLFRKHADQSYFDGINLCHDLNYRAAVHQPFGAQAGLKFADFDRKQYLSMEGSVGQNVMSCYGMPDTERVVGTFGMILKGYVIFASMDDLASHTIRTAHQDIVKKHRQSGLPKRTSPGQVHNPKAAERAKKWHPRRQKLAKMRGKELPDITDEELANIVNSVVLSGKDNDGERIGEVLVANWKIDKWFCMAETPEGLWPKHFWNRAKEVGIKQPILLVSNINGQIIREITIDDYHPPEREEP